MASINARPPYRGLKYTASKTANYTALPGDFVLCSASGGAFTVTLPAAPADNDQVGLYLSSDSANAVTISGTLAADDHDGKLYVQGDTLILQYSSTLAGWMTIYDGLISHCARMTLSANITTNSAATSTKITLDTQTYDVGYIADPTTNNRFDIRRPGKYSITLQSRPVSNVSDQQYYGVIVRVNGVNQTDTRFMQSGASNVMMPSCTLEWNCAASDYLEAYFLPQAANIGAAGGSDNTWFTISEIR